MGNSNSLTFEEGVDSYVPYAGKLKDNLDITIEKIKSTMCSCGATTLAEIKNKAKITLVSSTGIIEGGTHDVILKETRVNYGNCHFFVTIFAFYSCFPESLSCKLSPDTRICPPANFCAVTQKVVPGKFVPRSRHNVSQICTLTAKIAPCFAPFGLINRVTKAMDPVDGLRFAQHQKRLLLPGPHLENTDKNCKIKI